MVAGAAAVVAGINYRVNFYGLYGDVKGSKYIVYDNDRTTKYLFAYNYIPSNFDGLLIGSSTTLNWNTAELTSVRMYNASLDGGNISEEALIADQILRRHPPKLVLVLIHPYLTDTYGRKSGHMIPQEYWGGLGSIQLLRGYWSRWKIEHGYKRKEFNEFGTDNFFTHLPGGFAAATQHQPPYFVDARAFQEYRELIERVRASGARIVGVIPPMEMGAWKMAQEALDEYSSKARPLFRPDEPIIDLNVPEMDEFRKNKYNYQDTLHLAPDGASKVMKIIDNKLKAMGVAGSGENVARSK